MKRKYLIIILLPLLLCSFLSVGQSLGEVAPVLNDGLVGYFPFDEGTGTNTQEIIDGNNGTLTDSPQWVTGKYGYALNFTDNYVIANFSSSYVGGEDWSVSAWIKLNSFVSDSTILALYETGVGYAWQLNYNNVGQPYVYLYGVAGYIDPQSTFLLTNTWTLITATYNGTHGCFYVNDNLRIVKELTGNITVVADNPHLSIGKRLNDQPTNGIIDDVRIYSRALSYAEVSFLYEAVQPTPTPSPSPSATPFPEGAMDDTDWWISILVLLLIIINIFLMMLPFALVRFVFGILSLFLCMLALSYAIPLSPYLQTAGLLISALAMLFSVRARE